MENNTAVVPTCQNFSLSPLQSNETSTGSAEQSGAVSLPCLYSNNSPEIGESDCKAKAEDPLTALISVLTPYHKKQAQSLYLNVERLVNKEAISPNHIGFLTLTFSDNVKDYKEASRRFDSLAKHFLKEHPDFGHWICTKEQQRRGSWHYHLLVCLSEDIKTGVNFKELANRKYSSASPYLRKLWKDLREAMPKYKFGRSELQPIKSNAEAMGRYIGKYISKHVGQRDNDSKGARLITYSQGWPKNSMKMSWNTPNAKLWRMKVKLFAWHHGCSELYQLKEKLGSTWAYKYQEDILNVFEIISAHPKEPNLYNPAFLKKTERRRKEREEKMITDLTLHGRSIQEALRKENAKASLSSTFARNIDEWLASDDYNLKVAKWDKENVGKPKIDYATGEILTDNSSYF